MKRVGVLALQGAVSEHMDMLAAVGAAALAVRRPGDLDTLDALVIPGGESTAISRLMRRCGLHELIRDFARDKAVLGTCAGLILCAAEVAGSGGTRPGREGGGQDGADKVVPLRIMPMRAQRNGFGRQTESFETLLDVRDIGKDIPAVFIRAPYVEEAGDGVLSMAEVDGKIVMARRGKTLVTAFHPELAGDLRVMEYFCRMA